MDEQNDRVYWNNAHVNAWRMIERYGPVCLDIADETGAKIEGHSIASYFFHCDLNFCADFLISYVPSARQH